MNTKQRQNRQKWLIDRCKCPQKHRLYHTLIKVCPCRPFFGYTEEELGGRTPDEAERSVEDAKKFAW